MEIWFARSKTLGLKYQRETQIGNFEFLFLNHIKLSGYY